MGYWDDYWKGIKDAYNQTWGSLFSGIGPYLSGDHYKSNSGYQGDPNLVRKRAESYQPNQYERGVERRNQDLLDILNSKRPQYTGQEATNYWNNPGRTAYGGQNAWMYQPGVNDATPNPVPEKTLADKILEMAMKAALNPQGGSVPQLSLPYPGNLKKQAQQLYDQQYNPQIAAINKLIADSKKDSSINKGELNHLYGDLAGSYKGDTDFVQKQMASAKSAEDAAYQNLTKRGDQQYNSEMADQAAQFQKLGIQDALPQATQGQQADLQFLHELNATNDSAQKQYYDKLGAGESAYYNRMGGVAKLSGAQAVEQLMSTLTGQLREQRGNIAQLQGEKANAIGKLILDQQAANAQAKTAFSQQQAQSGNTQFDTLSKLFAMANTNENTNQNSMMDLLKLQQQMQGKTGKIPTKGLSGVAAYLQQAPGISSADNVQNGLMNFLQTTPQLDQQYETGSGYKKMTLNEQVHELRDFASKSGWGSADTDAAIKALYIMAGKY